MGNLLGVYLHSVGVYFGVLNNNISFKIENTKIQWGSMRSKKKKNAGQWEAAFLIIKDSDDTKFMDDI